MTKTMTGLFGWKITDRMIRTVMYGMDSPASTRRISSESANPPTNPDSAPYKVPNKTATIAAATPTSIDVWPPIISLPSTS